MGITARNWREYPQRYRMEAAKCNKCGKIFFPPRLVCNECGNREFEQVKLAGEGKLKTFTVIRVAPSNFIDEQPYAVGIVELTDGVSTLMQITDCDPDELSIGMRVKIEFRKVQTEGDAGILMYGYKAVPLRE
ncbi:MAG: Zn-ribbon domain-containing OB-fold protein [Melioribacteraceae bacterium]|nr:Zn-ribbon domain-containing OB-fold protein [Melioribacteraceae bacterium]MCF8355985.1 Zn-ribbon domain-containing OB-fold protein [Melioribacteraceae bacterium]MCF8394609.1 Zn-ribbon domain-containing OB-fold protein [Melioribacteraceae bacterium]MCF8419606.1 Zn-ribbon domain-containing OB-fold protein [Melioribacteraceae bacterium]